jgi:hypothetical protein
MLMHAHRMLLVGFVGLVAAACASATQRAKSTSRPNAITREELASLPSTNAYDAIERLRPGWLRRPTAPTLLGENPLLVYVDHQLVGGVDELRSMSTDQVEQMEFITAPNATNRHGTGNASGAIEITTRRG